MHLVKWRELFPTKFSAVIFVSYMALFINQGILVTASQNSDKKYGYNTTLVVLLTEAIKLIISASLYCKNESFSLMLVKIKENYNLLVLYFVPSLLYCFYNNLAFVNLTSFDPTSYYLLLQFRVVITALLFQVIFKKYLTVKQWVALLMLTVGCMIKHVDVKPADAGHDVLRQIFSFSAVMILIQSFCSSLAGVYNEYLLKNDGLAVDIYIQNVFMYLDSIVCNLVIILYQGKSTSTFDASSFAGVFHVNVLLIMLNNAAVGVVTSFFLRTLNSILKTFASALELVFTAVACYIIFGIPINNFTVVSIMIVSLSIIVYSQNPVDNQPKPAKICDDQLHLLEEGQKDTV